MIRKHSELIWLIVMLVIAIALLVWMFRPSYSVGTLYLGENQERVCEGQLKTIPVGYGNVLYDFQCTNGQVIHHLTNFIVR